MCDEAKDGHVTSAFSCAEIVAALYYSIMNIKPEDPTWKNRDRFIMSKNHGSVITYPILEDLGYFSAKHQKPFLMNDGYLGGHTKLTIPGADFAGGSLGIGLGVGAGLAYAAKQDLAQWNTYCIIGDGECYEGSIWESVMFAAANNLNNLVVFLDRNRLTLSDFTENMLPLESMEDKWKAFGWNVKTINGHNIKEIIDAVSEVPRRESNKPLCVICNTSKGKGIDYLEDKMYRHGFAPTGDQAKEAIRQIMEGN